MKRYYLIVFSFFLISISTFAQPWVNDNAHWKYYFEEEHPDALPGLYETIKVANIDTLGKLCDQLISRKQYFQYNNGWNPASDTIIVDTNYTYKSVTGDTIFWLENGVFQILYDFSKELNDTWIFSILDEVSWEGCNDTSTVKVIDKNLAEISGASYRNFEMYTPPSEQQYLFRGIYNERFGLSEGEAYIFPLKDHYCSSDFGIFDMFYSILCFEDDSIAYDVNCDFILGIEELNKSIVISPNPFQSGITINGIEDCEKIVITDLRGMTIKEFSTMNELNTTSLEHLVEGVYFIQIQQKNTQISTIKILKN